MAHLLSRTDWDELVLRRLDTLVGLEPARDAHKTALIEESQAPSHFVDLHALREAGTPYLAAVSGNTRYQIKRALKEYGKQGPLSVVQAQTVGQALDYLARLKNLHQDYWVEKGEPGAFANDFFDRFHRALVAARFDNGEIQLLRIGTEAEAIGYLYNFVHAGQVYNYQSGFRYGASPQLKPGILSHYLAIEHNLQGGAARYDFLAGDYQYKKSLGTHASEMVWVTVQRERLRFQAEEALRRLKRRVLPATTARWQALVGRWRAAR
jgi:CelD/BcsL family acetyltransferase involved in cellulose biosynthesis